MARKANMRDIRAALIRINSELVGRNVDGIVRNQEIIARLRADYESDISILSDELVNRSLIKILNDVSGRRSSENKSPMQGDLFLELHKVPNLLPIRKGLKKDTLKFTIGELEEWLKTHDAKIVRDKNKGLKETLKLCKNSNIFKDETIGDILGRVT